MSIVSLVTQAATYYADDPYMHMDGGPTMMTDEQAIGLSIFMVLFALVIAVVVYVVMAIFLGKIFKKAGIESWKAWVPIYNNWVLLELGDQKGYWAVLAIIPVVNIVAAVFMYIAMYNIGLKFGKEGAFVLLAIFLPLVWMIWLAVDKSTWKGSTPVAATAPASSAEPKPAAPDDDRTPPAV